MQSLVKDVDATSASMLQQLLQKLRSNIQLPDCLRMIGYLRRLGVFTERVSFRHSHITKQGNKGRLIHKGCLTEGVTMAKCDAGC